jgi:hypothetical protein
MSRASLLRSFVCRLHSFPRWSFFISADSALQENEIFDNQVESSPLGLHSGHYRGSFAMLSVDAAREVIPQGVADVFTHAKVESLPSASIKSWCETWTEAKAIETEEFTHARYKRVIERFADFLGEAKNKRDLSTLQARDVARFRDREAKELSRSTANLGVKVLRICLGEAVRQGLLASARHRCRTSSEKFSLPPDLSSRDPADTKAPAKAVTKRAKRARFHFTVCPQCGDDVESGRRFRLYYAGDRRTRERPSRLAAASKVAAWVLPLIVATLNTRSAHNCKTPNIAVSDEKLGAF